MSSSRLLFIDFDGVLHAQHNDAPTIATLPFEDLAAERPDLFGWAPLLADVLRGKACAVVVHSSWRGFMSDADIKRLLGPLSRRFIGCTQRSLPREESVLEYIASADGRSSDFRVLDDEPQRFTSGRLDGKLLVTDPLKGVSDPRILCAVRCFVEAN